MEFLLSHSPLLYLTQGIWRDEAFSLLLAQRPISSFITSISFEPPLYYVFLHIWMKLFGTGEIAARSLSLVGFSLATVLVIFWAERIFKKHWLSWFLPVFFFFNPMLLYYAFEIRAYGWYMFFAVASMFTYMERKYPWHILATTLGMYTHAYMAFIPLVQGIHYLTYRSKHSQKWTIRSVLADPMLRSFATVFVAFIPWMTKAVIDLHRLKYSWYFPVDMQLIKSVLGNVFIGYEGTPWYLWQHTARLSLILLVISISTLIPLKTRERNAFFFLMVFLPLIIILGVSLIKPLFVMRYVIFASIALIFLIVLAIEQIKNTHLQKGAATVALLFVLGFNLWYAPLRPKGTMRDTLAQINAMATERDVIMTDSPLILFEAMYYNTTASGVYWYNPQREAFPWYIGDIIMSASNIAYDLPPYPIRAFIIHQDGTYDISYQAPISQQNTKPSGAR